jgi:putative PIN family toxin of toxin-antitoxin system
MRVLLDTNVLISYLLSRNPELSAAQAVLSAAANAKFTLLYVVEVVEEFQRELQKRPELAARIPPDRAAHLVRELRSLGTPVQKLAEPYPAICRDRNDDFLIAHAIVAEADYLVSWDRDLLDLREVGGVQIVSPPELLAILREHECSETT